MPRRSPNRWLSDSLVRALRGSGGASNRRHHRIGQRGPNASDLRVRARGIHAVAEENDEHITRRVNPDRGPGKSGVAERALRHEVACRVPSIRLLPAERAVLQLSRREELDRLRAHDLRTVERTPTQIHASKAREVVRRAEDARVGRDTAEVVRAFIVNDAPYLAAANGVDLGRRDARLQ